MRIAKLQLINSSSIRDVTHVKLFNTPRYIMTFTGPLNASALPVPKPRTSKNHRYIFDLYIRQLYSLINVSFSNWFAYSIINCCFRHFTIDEKKKQAVIVEPILGSLSGAWCNMCWIIREQASQVFCRCSPETSSLVAAELYAVFWGDAALKSEEARKAEIF